MNEVITDYNHDREETLTATSAAIIKGCTNNTALLIVTLLSIVVSTTADFNSV